MKAAAVLAFVFMASSSHAGPDRASILLGSYHAGAPIEFEETNPGIFLTWEKDVLDWSVGVYRNSFGKTSMAVTAALPVATWEDGEASLFAGLALYPGDGRYFAVHAGDVVPIGGVQVRHHHLFVQVIPSDGKVVDAIFAAGLTFPMP